MMIAMLFLQCIYFDVIAPVCVCELWARRFVQKKNEQKQNTEQEQKASTSENQKETK